nr:unnamed protein product [Callosobruchus analis]CAI5822659.1 unnamed protein product [Callosobruchus analis]CAI5827071.1 unnamed protein product [Callosobruchus analis]CAI5849126.1 unnamed protein product [Callosobruchus analis]CAI5851594.1 unnamed protein product [Callosobruchus analis]
MTWHGYVNILKT